MKKKLNPGLAGLLMCLLMIVPSVSNAQSEKEVIEKYLRELAAVPVSNALQKYRMTAVYTNRDLYGNFMEKTKVLMTIGYRKRAFWTESSALELLLLDLIQEYKDMRKFWNRFRERYRSLIRMTGLATFHNGNNTK